MLKLNLKPIEHFHQPQTTPPHNHTPIHHHQPHQPPLPHQQNPQSLSGGEKPAFFERN